MARRLLEDWRGARTARPLSAMLPLLLTACVIPVPPEEAPPAENHPPVIIGGEPVGFVPQPGSDNMGAQVPAWTPAQNTDEWAFGVTAWDQDQPPQGTLKARVYRARDSHLDVVDGMTMLATTDPSIFTGEVPIARPYCDPTKLKPGTYFFYVYVTDQDQFPIDPRSLAQGRFDFKYWVVTCP